MAGCWSTGSYVRGIKIIFARDADEREQGVATRVGQGSAHAMRARHVGNETDRPIRGDPFTRGMREHCGQIDEARCLVDGRGLHGCDLMLTEGFADDIETARERRIAKGAFLLARSPTSYGGGERFFRIDEFGLGLRQGCGQSGNRLTGSLHGSPPVPRRQSSPRRILSALLAPHVRSPLWRPRA